MHETRDDLAALQRLLDDSYARAGAHLRSIQRPEHRLDAARLCERLQKVCVVDLATVTRAGEPRVAPIDALFFRARFCIGASADSQRARQLGHNPAVSAAYTRRALTVLVHGTALEIDCADPRESGLRDCFRESYGFGYDSFGSWGKAPFWRIEPRLMFAAVLSE
jgi:Pyridoxamine 5'-phosphate oxidase